VFYRSPKRAKRCLSPVNTFIPHRHQPSHPMGEIVNVLVAFAVIVFIFRWATSGFSFGLAFSRSGADWALFIGNNPHDNSRQRSPAELLGFRPKSVTQEMVRLNGLFSSCLCWDWSLMSLAQISTISNMFPDIPAYALPSPTSAFCINKITSIPAITLDMIYCALVVLRLPRTKYLKEDIWNRYVI
jgi:hypothetical protein